MEADPAGQRAGGAPPPRVHETATAAETETLAAAEGAGLMRGDLVLVLGDLGAGKTTFIRGACRGLGVTGPVTSPTFTIGRRYDGASLPVSHLDLYRLGSLAAEDPGLLTDYLTDDAVAFVEWPEVAGDALPEPRLTVRLEHLGGDRRRIELTP